MVDNLLACDDNVPLMTVVRESFLLMGLTYNQVCEVVERIDAICERADTLSTYNGTTFTRTWSPTK